LGTSSSSRAASMYSDVVTCIAPSHMQRHADKSGTHCALSKYYACEEHMQDISFSLAQKNTFPMHEHTDITETLADA